MHKKQTRVTVSFKDNDQEQKLYEWINSKSEIIGVANAIKQILNKAMIEEVEGK